MDKFGVRRNVTSSSSSRPHRSAPWACAKSIATSRWEVETRLRGIEADTLNPEPPKQRTKARRFAGQILATRVDQRPRAAQAPL